MVIVENPVKRRVVYANLQKNKMSSGYSLIVKKCQFCKREHVHSGEEGHRVAHCFDKKTGKSLPVAGYDLRVDWNKPKNAALREEYAAFYAKANES